MMYIEGPDMPSEKPTGRINWLCTSLLITILCTCGNIVTIGRLNAFAVAYRCSKDEH